VVKLENQKIIFTEKFRELAIESFTKVYNFAAINLFDLGLDSGIILTDLEIKYFNSQFGKDSISYQF
jgi:hypothetical protein